MDDAINLTAIMEREGIRCIKRWAVGPYTVEMSDGRVGTGANVGEAFAKAKADTGEILKRALAA